MLFNVPLPPSLVQEKNSKEVDLLQCYMSNPSLATSICTTHLPPNLQSFIKTFSLQTKHSPMHPIPSPNIMVEPTLGVITRVEATNKGEGRLQEKWQAFNHANNNIALNMLYFLVCHCCFLFGSLFGKFIMFLWLYGFRMSNKKKL
jgi:hypothetical protein